MESLGMRRRAGENVSPLRWARGPSASFIRSTCCSNEHCFIKTPCFCLFSCPSPESIRFRQSPKPRIPHVGMAEAYRRPKGRRCRPGLHTPEPGQEPGKTFRLPREEEGHAPLLPDGFLSICTRSTARSARASISSTGPTPTLQSSSSFPTARSVTRPSQTLVVSVSYDLRGHVAKIGKQCSLFAGEEPHSIQRGTVGNRRTTASPFCKNGDGRAAGSKRARKATNDRRHAVTHDGGTRAFGSFAM